jgi:hypothetical protein
MNRRNHILFKQIFTILVSSRNRLENSHLIILQEELLNQMKVKDIENSIRSLKNE